MVVVFPAPLGPRKPRISPFSTLKEIASTAVCRPYLLVRFSTSIMFCQLLGSSGPSAHSRAADRAFFAAVPLRFRVPVGAIGYAPLPPEAPHLTVLGPRAGSSYHSERGLALSINGPQ